MVLLVLVPTAAAATVSGTVPNLAKPVIGKPVTAPVEPMAGKPFSVSFKVTWSDSGAPVTRGRMICDPSVAGQTIRHAESFKGGRARLSFVVPTSAAGKLLKVKVTIKAAATQPATKVATFRVRRLPALSIGDAMASEGGPGTTTLSVPVTLSAPASQVVSVAYATVDGTAASGSDYMAASGTLTFRPGENAKTIQIGLVADRTIEPDETFTVALSSPVNATIVDGTASVTIVNDDTDVPVTPGSYKGATQTGDYVFFTVTPGRMLTGFRVNDVPCPCEGGGEVSGAVDWTDNAFTIRADGSFVAEGSWTGSETDGDVEWTNWYAKLTGSFGTPTSASGTIVIKWELKYKGIPYRCSTAEVRWSATLQS